MVVIMVQDLYIQNKKSVIGAFWISVKGLDGRGKPEPFFLFNHKNDIGHNPFSYKLFSSNSELMDAILGRTSQYISFLLIVQLQQQVMHEVYGAL